MNEEEVTSLLDRYFTSKGLESLRQFNIFDHEDDSKEKSFRIDLAFKPVATKGNRSGLQKQTDVRAFEKMEETIQQSLSPLNDVCAFPTSTDLSNNWRKQYNPNPMVGLAIEVENNNTSKYFLGSLLAASIAGRWGILVALEDSRTDLWINTIRRMIHKGSTSPIPSNILIFKWTSLKDCIETLIEQKLE